MLVPIVYFSIFHCSLLKAAEEVHLPKTLRCEYGGGLKEFTQQEADHFEGINDERTFFTTQERQWLVLHLLETLRASKEDQVGGLRFIEGQAIGEQIREFGFFLLIPMPVDYFCKFNTYL